MTKTATRLHPRVGVAHLNAGRRSVKSIRSEYRRDVGDLRVTSIVDVQFGPAEYFTPEELKTMVEDIDCRALPIAG